MSAIRAAGNIIWFLTGGLIGAIIWLTGGVLFALTIVGLPMFRACVEMAKLSAFPFGKDVVHVREIDNKGIEATTVLTGTVGFIFNLIWLVTFGWILCVLYLGAGLINFVFIVTIPFALQAFKLAAISLWPVGKRVVAVELSEAIKKSNAEAALGKLRAK